MPFLSPDWRSPGEKWVRYEGGWKMKKTVWATQCFRWGTWRAYYVVYQNTTTTAMLLLHCNSADKSVDSNSNSTNTNIDGNSNTKAKGNGNSNIDNSSNIKAKCH